MEPTAAHAADLSLARACARGERQALARLEELLASVVPQAAARLRPSNAFLDEVKAGLRDRLLVGDRPRILEYQGRGALRNWLRAAALRIGLNLLAARRPAGEDDSALEGLCAPGADPELSFLQRTAAPELNAALEEALRTLPARERSLLRLYFVQGLTVEEIGRLESAHKSTVSRWLTRTRAGLLATVRARLQARLRLQPAELDSLIVALQGELHVSLGRVL